MKKTNRLLLFSLFAFLLFSGNVYSQDYVSASEAQVLLQDELNVLTPMLDGDSNINRNGKGYVQLKNKFKLYSQMLIAFQKGKTNIPELMISSMIELFPDAEINRESFMLNEIPDPKMAELKTQATDLLTE